MNIVPNNEIHPSDIQIYAKAFCDINGTTIAISNVLAYVIQLHIISAFSCNTSFKYMLKTVPDELKAIKLIIIPNSYIGILR